MINLIGNTHFSICNAFKLPALVVSRIAQAVARQFIYLAQLFKSSFYRDRSLAPSASELPKPATLNFNIGTKQELLDHRKLPLEVTAERPTQEYPIDKTRAQEWINACEGEYKTLAEKLVANIQHITFSDLQRELTACVAIFNESIAKEPSEYAVGLTVGKSLQWVTSLAVEHLAQLPNAYFPLGRGGSTLAGYEGKNNFVDTTELTVSKVNEKVLAIFDDCSFTGTQLLGFLSQINNQLKERKVMYVVIPFMAESIKKELTGQPFANLQIKLISSSTPIRPLKEIFTVAEQQMLRKMTQPVSMNVTLCYTDWRLPDGTSTCQELVTGMPSMAASGRTKYAVACEKEEIVFRKHHYYKLIPYSSIPRPYGIQ